MRISSITSNAYRQNLGMRKVQNNTNLKANNAISFKDKMFLEPSDGDVNNPFIGGNFLIVLLLIAAVIAFPKNSDKVKNNDNDSYSTRPTTSQQHYKYGSRPVDVFNVTQADDYKTLIFVDTGEPLNFAEQQDFHNQMREIYGSSYDPEYPFG